MNIDREIAEKVMGYCERPVHGIGWWHQAEENRWFVAQYLWHPSTDIAQAFEVVEKLLKHPDNKMGCFHLEHLNEGNGWSVSCCYDLGEWKDWIHADTPAMAICLAALKAMEA